VLVLAARDDRARRWVADRYGRVLQRAVAAVLGPEGRVELVIDGADATTARESEGEPAPRRPELNPKLTFDQFVIGDHNRLAHAAALTVAELPGTAYNPLFIYGPPGCGKTHLLQAIANFVLAHDPSLHVRYTSAERFTNEFVAALRDKAGMDAFKARYRANDVLLIDDVQFLEAKAKTEEEFFHTFNALYDSGAQLVLTSDRTPADLTALAQRLRDRFAAGLVTDVRPPDRAARMAILRKRAALDDIDASRDVLEAIAGRAFHNVRELEGALIGVVAYASLTGCALTEEVVDARLGPGAPRERRPERDLTVGEIQDAVCAHFGLTREELLSKSRVGRITWPRQVAMYLAREETSLSFPAIGAAFAGRNHTTVMHAVRHAQARLAEDAQAAAVVRSLSDRLRADLAD